jgi:putative ABC transport system permease protein
MKLLVILAWRNLWRKKRRTFISVSSILFAVVLAISLMSLIEGTREVMIETIVTNSTGHLQVQDALYHDEPSMDHALEYCEEIKSTLAAFSSDISYTVPRIQGFCLGAKETGTRGVYVMGIVPEKENRMNDLSSKLVEGKMFADTDQFAVIARGVANLLDLTVGDSIILMGQGFQGMTAAGIYKVGGVVEFNMPEQNNTLVYLPLKEAQQFFSAPDRLNSLIIMVDDERVVDDLAESLRAELDPEWFAVKTWEELLPDAIAALEARDAQVKVFAWILYIVAGFGIFGTIITMMYERLREFGILLSIGLKRTQLSAICLLETIFMGLLGVFAGIAIGYPIMYWLNKNPIPLNDDLAEVMLDMGFEPVLPFSVAPDIFIYQGITIFFIALIVSLYPIKKVFKLDMISAARK